MFTKENSEIKKILSFLTEIGIDVIEKELNDTFLPGLDLGPNYVIIDYDKLLYPGDILHEAGHLAVTSSSDRKLVGTEKIASNWPTEAEEMAAILWSFAACSHLELPIELVFHPDGYKNDSEWLISNFTSGNFIGLPFLEWIGLTLGSDSATKEGKPAFPTMLKWMRE